MNKRDRIPMWPASIAIAGRRGDRRECQAPASTELEVQRSTSVLLGQPYRVAQLTGSIADSEPPAATVCISTSLDSATSRRSG
jgi:hypothetical protein